MTDHDPLCLYSDDGYGSSCEICRVIAKVRANERDKTMQRADISAAIDMAVTAERERIAQAIETMRTYTAEAKHLRVDAAQIAREGAS